MTSIRIKRRANKFGVLLCLVAASLFTCEKVPEYCGKGTGKDSWLGDGQFCFGDKAYDKCRNGRDYDPSTQGCDQNGDVGTRCPDNSVVPQGTPCGGYTLTVTSSPENGGSVVILPAAASYSAGEQVILTASASTGYEFIGWTGELESASSTIQITMSGSNANKAIVAVFRANQST